jgi:hypothetical protein
MASDEQVREALLSHLSAAERNSAVAYCLTQSVSGGTRFSFPQLNFEAPWDAALIFIDQQPLANWGHPCRYVLLNPGTHETISFQARFPPFQPETKNLWRVLYRASAIPDSAIAVPDPPPTDRSYKE